MISLCVFVNASEVSPRFENDEFGLDVESAQVIRGQPIRVQCQATSFPPPMITWHKDGIELSEEDFGDRMVLHEDGKELEIRAAEEEDAGRYKCIANNVAGLAEKITDVYVWGALLVLAIHSVSPKTIRIELEQPLDAVSRWMGERTLCLHRPLSVRRFYSFRLLSSTIFCFVITRLHSVEKLAPVACTVAPEIDETIASDRNLSVIVTRPFFINCPVIGGIPPPEVVWYKDEKLIVRGQDKGIKVVSSGQRLEFDAVDITDAGTYSCEARNPAGIAERQHNLTVLGQSNTLLH